MPFRRYFIDFYGRKKISFDFIFSIKMMSKLSLNDLLIIVLNTSVNIILTKSISIVGIKTLQYLKNIYIILAYRSVL